MLVGDGEAVGDGLGDGVIEGVAAGVLAVGDCVSAGSGVQAPSRNWTVPSLVEGGAYSAGS